MSALDALLLEQEAKMLRTLAYTTLYSAALIGSSAYAADTTVPANPPTAQIQTSAAVNFVTSQEKTQ